MSKEYIPKGSKKGAVRRCDLTEYVTRPLASQMKEMESLILEKIQSVEDSVNILARQKARDLREKSTLPHLESVCGSDDPGSNDDRSLADSSGTF